MNEQMRQEIAHFRYSLIAPVVSRQNLSRGETRALFDSIAKGQYQIPYSTRKTVGVRTLEHYLQLYRSGGLEALKPGSRKVDRKIPRAYLEQAALLRRENPARSILQIIAILEKSGKVPAGILKRSTLYDYFLSVGLTRKTMDKPKEHYRRFGASYRNEILQGDIHHTMYLPDPSRPGFKRKVFLFVIHESRP